MNSELIKKLQEAVIAYRGPDAHEQLVSDLSEAIIALHSADKQIIKLKAYIAKITDDIERAMRRPKP